VRPRARLFAGRLLLFDRGREAVAAPRDVLDVAAPVRADAEHLPQQVDVLRQVRLLDERVGPEPLHQLFLADEAALLPHEEFERFDRLRLERHDLAVRPVEQTLGDVQLKPAEFVEPPARARHNL
jgi:hypothetical protein